MKFTTTLLAAAGLALVASAASASAFTSYIIRNGAGNVPPQILSNNTYVPNATEFVISAGSMKAGWGTNDQNGVTLGNITRLAITRHDDTTRFSAGSGPAVAPYFNIWITNGTQFAVVANEPSNPSFNAFRTSGPGNGLTYDFSIADIANEPAKIYETAGSGGTNTWVHQELGKVGQTLTFSDLVNYVIQAPSAAYITGPNSVGSGAPRELGTNTAYGINWIFGDTLSNYVSGMEGFVVSNPIAIPAPASASLLALGGLLAARRRRN